MPKVSPQKSSRYLPEELLQYLATCQVVVCTACQYAIQPKVIARHLKEIDRWTKSSERQRFLDHVGRRYELAEHELVMQFTPRESPVPLLPIQNGLQCRSEGSGVFVRHGEADEAPLEFCSWEARTAHQVAGDQLPFRPASKAICCDILLADCRIKVK